MVAFSGADPIGVLIGAKRPSGTLVHRIAVHPDHLRQGHGRHLLTSLGSKLAILGPPRILAEVPEGLAPARELFRACGYVEEAILTDYVLECDPYNVHEQAGAPGQFVIPVTVDDLDANGLLQGVDPQVCWQRSVETIAAKKDAVEGFAVASDERIEAYLLYIKDGAAAELTRFRSFFADEPSTGLGAGAGARLTLLLARLCTQGIRTIRFPKVYSDDFPHKTMEAQGFKPAGGHVVYAARARSH